MQLSSDTQRVYVQHHKSFAQLQPWLVLWLLRPIIPLPFDFVVGFWEEEWPLLSFIVSADAHVVLEVLADKDFRARQALDIYFQVCKALWERH